MSADRCHRLHASSIDLSHPLTIRFIRVPARTGNGFDDGKGKTMNKLLSLSAVSVLCVANAAAAQVAIDFGNIEYRKLETRGATESAMLDKLMNQTPVRWSPWMVLTPFVGNEKGFLARPLPPEDELPRMTAGGPGPDLNARYTGKQNREIGWQKLSDEPDRAMSLKIYKDDELNVRGTGYLYCTATVDRAVSLPVTMGSDDGLRFWLNGKLLIDADVPRGLNVEDHRLTLDLKPGVNHLLAKVTQGQGGWDFQLITRTARVDPILDAKLQYQLNADFPTDEDAYYRIATVPVPLDVVLEVGGLDTLPDGRIAVCTRRGDVYLVEYADEDPPFDARFRLFASGLHEPLGVAARTENGQLAIYCVQRPELTRLVDTNGDGRADLYDTFCDAWGVSGNYHEFAFGPKFDAEGNAWVTLNVGFCDALGKSIAPYRGWAVKVTPDRRMIPVCDGLRSPNGIGFNALGDCFYADNQGDYVATNKLSWMSQDSYHGHPAGLRWRRNWQQGDPEPARTLPAVWFPYKKMGQSAADCVMDTTGGRFGPFAGQLFVGDQFSAIVMRVALEKVSGPDGDFYQGACFPFRRGLDCGVNRLTFDKNGGMIVGQTDRGWGSIGRLRYGLQRIVWTGRTPFEPLTVHAAPRGFVVTFTEDVDPASAEDVKSYSMSSYTYRYHATYGSPEIQTQTPTVTAAKVTGPRTVALTVEGLRDGGEGFVHEIGMSGVKAKDGRGLLHPIAYYTLHRIPADEPTVAGR